MATSNNGRNRNSRSHIPVVSSQHQQMGKSTNKEDCSNNNNKNNNKMSAFGWSCKKCTFFHHTRSPRCSMCGELRGASRQEMHDFILGKPVRPIVEGNVIQIHDDDDNDNDNNNDPVSSTIEGTVGRRPTATTAERTDEPLGGTTCNAMSHHQQSCLPAAATSSKESTNPELSFRPRPSSSLASAIASTGTNPYLSKRGPTTTTTTSTSTSIISTAGNSNAQQPMHRMDDDYCDEDQPYNRELSNNERLLPVHEKGPRGNNTREPHPSIAFQNHSLISGECNTRQIDVRPTLNSSSTALRAPSPLAIVKQNKTESDPCGQQEVPQQQETTTVVKEPHPFFDRTNSIAVASTSTGRDEKKKKKGQGKQQRQPIHRIPFFPGPVPFNADNCRTWIYPEPGESFPTRQYQVEIAETALEYNTLVSLPTGLGKTRIAAVVLYNFYRWFAPVGKVLFLAPTLPLVNQQVQACYDVMGIPAHDTAVLTGRIRADVRATLWKERRVFYCTPQTVQRDLEACIAEAESTGLASTTSFASQVVCLVLDEAHKASGDYAYTKVVDLLDGAGAKFRTVGLSATPGSTIQAIQAVVDALRTVRIEFRDEAHPTVTPYLHQKQTEIVICPQDNGQKEVEKLFTRMLGPLLERLRNEGGFRYTGNATMTTYSVHQAKEAYVRNCGPGRANGGVISCYAAASTIVQLRNECCQSLGTVKMKMLRLKSHPQRGILNTIVKSDEFGSILQRVIDVTTGNDGSGPTLLGPKLAKLSELLHHHFERAEAAGKSSRAIVFAQFRDSVSEIVDSLACLAPKVRPRHFVGQGNSSANVKDKSNNSNYNGGDQRLAGMKQAEQHKVIKAFRNNVYNVLVCTCIGEEGLDIGDVDLIVNFDVLKSPIRTIQRAGRTGRKRDGRVVCLISEGSEQQSHQKRLNNERTLHAALQNGKNFKMASHYPMLPHPTTMEFRKMDISSQLHLSQVAGARHTPSTKQQRGSAGGTAAWRLDDEAERERQQRCGETIIALDEDVAWRTLRRVFLRSAVNPIRLPLPQQHRRRRLLQHHRSFTGRNLQILNLIEKFGSIHTAGTTRGYQDIHKVFPIEARDDVKSNDKHHELPNEDPGKPINRSLWTDEPADASLARCPIEGDKVCKPLIDTLLEPTEPSGIPAFDVGSDHGAHSRPSNIQAGESMVQPPGAEELNDPAVLNDGAMTLYSPSRNIPYSESETHDAIMETKLASSSDGLKAVDPIVLKEYDPAPYTEVHHSNLAYFDSKSGEIPSRVVLHQPQPVQTKIDEVTFRLPTPPPSSSSDSDDDDDDESAEESVMAPMPQPATFQEFYSSVGEEHIADPVAHPNHRAEEPNHNDFKLNESNLHIQNESVESIESVEVVPNRHLQCDLLFRLPTQDSSSSEDEEDGEFEEAILPNPTFPISDTILNGGSCVMEHGLGPEALIPETEARKQMTMDPHNTELSFIDSVNTEGRNSYAMMPSVDHVNVAAAKGSPSSSRGHEQKNEDNESDVDVPLISLKRTKRDKAICVDSQRKTDAQVNLLPHPSTKRTQKAKRTHGTDGQGGDDEDTDDDIPLIAFKNSHGVKDRKKALHLSIGGRDDNNFPATTNADHPKNGGTGCVPLAFIARETNGSDPKPSFSIECSGSQDIVAPLPNYAKARNRRRIMESQDSDTGSQEGPASGLVDHVDNEDHIDIGRIKKRPRIESIDSCEKTDAKVASSLKRRHACGTQLQETSVKETPIHLKPSLGVLLDTPDDVNHTAGLLNDSIRVDDSADDVVCQVCRMGDSSSDDEIVLCDSCNMGFHQKCYGMGIDPNDDNPWFCDMCNSTVGSAVACVYCSNIGGIQNRQCGGKWSHPLCSMFLSRPSSLSSSISRESVTCCVCTKDDAMACNALGCHNAVHPYCALTGGWTIVCSFNPSLSSTHPKKEGAMFCPEHINQAPAHSSGGRIINSTSDLYRVDRKVACRPRKLVKRKGTTTVSAATSHAHPPLHFKHSPDSGCEVVDVVGNEDDDAAKLERQQRRRQVLAKFVLEEAEIDSNDDGDDDEEEEEVRRIEEEEEADKSQDSFINDNVYLTQYHSQDELGRIDPDAAAAGRGGGQFDYYHNQHPHHHRAIDVQREIDNQFKTPCFNRQMVRNIDEGMSIPSSERGLGQMNFIRSVLEHHRQGGDCNDIEELYWQVAAQQDGSDLYQSAGGSSSSPTPFEQQHGRG